MKQLHLFKLTLVNHQEYFVVAASWEEAEAALLNQLDKHDVGFRAERKVYKMEWVTSTPDPVLSAKYWSSSEERLLIVPEVFKALKDDMDDIDEITVNSM